MVTLIILDGFGESEKLEGNAIKQAGTPYLDKLKKNFPHVQIGASGEHVGLPKGQMGNSEVGHLTIGSGRILPQSLERINAEIKNKTFFENKYLIRATEFTKDTGGCLHLIGMLSDGGVHSHTNHLKALITLAEKQNVKKTYLHLITDGRDTSTTAGKEYLKDIEKFIEGKNVEIATICGRVYAMDRENRWKNTMQAYDAIVLGQAEKYFQTPEKALQSSYDEGIFDEYVKPIVIGKPKTIDNGDSIIFFNFRPDRMRQLARSITEDDFNIFPRKKLAVNYFVSLTEYDNDLKKIQVAFKNEYLKNTLAEVLSNNNKTQFHVAETTKYAHVTYYFNGGQEKEFAGETRMLIPTHSDPDFTHNPEMKALEITAEAIDAINSQKFDFIIVNYSNADMLGHTANMEATKKAIAFVDKNAYALALNALLAGSDCIITADHGNAEKLLEDDGTACTSHTNNPVEFILLTPEALNTMNEHDKKGKKSKKEKTQIQKTQNFKLHKNGGLANIAPTILELLNIPTPPEMTAKSLISHNPRKI